MALTKDFKDTIQARAQRDPAFRKALLQEGVECLLAGDVDTGKAVLRDYIRRLVLPARSSAPCASFWTAGRRTACGSGRWLSRARLPLALPRRLP